MDATELHPDARTVIDQRGDSLVASITQQHNSPNPDPFPSKRTFGPVIESKDIIGEMKSGRIDITGAHVARIFDFKGVQYGLSGDAYQALRRLAEIVLKNKTIRSLVRPIFIEEKIFDWCKRKFRGETSANLSDHLLLEVTANVHKVEIWVPLSEFEAESDFAVGPARIRVITTDIVDRLDHQMVEKAPEEAKEIVRQHIQMRREKLQGGAAVVVEMAGENDFVFDSAVEIAETVIGFISFFSPPSVTPWKTCICSVLGSQGTATAEAFSFEANSFRNYQTSMRQTNGDGLRLRTADIEYYLSNGLSALGALVREEGLNEFQKAVRKAILMFSKGIRSPDLNDRLMYTFSALEGILIKGSEPIQQNLGERMAFMLEQKPDDRLKVVKAVKDAYELRSGFVHHSLPIKEAKALEEICLIAWKAAFGFIPNCPRFSTKNDFIDAVDRMKFGG